MHATTWWVLQRARVRLTQAVKAAQRAGWSTPDDPLSQGLAALGKQERAAGRAAVRACAIVYPVVTQLVAETRGLGNAVPLFLGLVPPLRRIEEFPGFPSPSALWAYCGLSAERRAKFDRRARMLAIAYIGTTAVMTSSGFRDLYRARRAVTTTRDWQKAHAHRDAVRYVAKRILKYVWLCRLPVGTPQDSLAPLDLVLVAGAAPSVGLPTDTLPALENPHGDAASAPGLDAFTPSDLHLAENLLSAPESDPLPQVALEPDQLVSTSDAE